MTISLHAIERFAQRVLNIDRALSLREKLSIRIMILRIIKECCPCAYELQNGKFVVSDYDCNFIFDHDSLVTVTNARNRPSFLEGGIRRSGRKIKKFLTEKRLKRELQRNYYERTRLAEAWMGTKESNTLYKQKG